MFQVEVYSNSSEVCSALGAQTHAWYVEIFLMVAKNSVLLKGHFHQPACHPLPVASAIYQLTCWHDLGLLGFFLIPDSLSGYVGLLFSNPMSHVRTGLIAFQRLMLKRDQVSELTHEEFT